MIRSLVTQAERENRLRVKRKLLPKRENTRPGRAKRETTGIVVHWTGNPHADAQDHIRFFRQLHSRYASYHYIVDCTGDVYQMIPDDEVAWHAGPANKTPEPIIDLLGQYPNWRTIGIAMCHTKLTKIPYVTADAAAELTARLMIRHGIGFERLLRHYDCTGKDCPGPWAGADNLDWKAWLRTVAEHDDKLEGVT